MCFAELHFAILKDIKTKAGPMRIGCEVQSLSADSITGVRRAIAQYLQELGSIDADVEWYVFSNRPITLLPANCQHWTIVTTDVYFEKLPVLLRKILLRLFNNEYFFTMIWIPCLARKYQLDAYLGTSIRLFPQLMPRKVRSFWLVHDIIWKLFPATMNRSNLFLMKIMFCRNARTAHELFTVSESTKKDVSKVLGIKTPKTVVPLGADRGKFERVNEKKIRSVLSKYKITKPYILAVGTVEPRKNHLRLIKAFLSMLDHCDHMLVICGAIGWECDDVVELIKSDGQGRIIITGYIEDGDLAPLYSGADIFVFPSLYEGFGLPVLEAMQCGCPVITSDIAATAEVAGDAALLVDPYNVEEIKEAIQKLVGDVDLRKRLSRKGYARVDTFSWKRSAHIMLSCMNSQGTGYFDPAGNKKQIAVILLNYNGWSDTIECVESLLKSTIEPGIIIVDNASNDDSQIKLKEYLAHKKAGNVILIENPRNGGFGAGTNTGIRNAILQGYELFWILNNDTIVEPDALEKMLCMYLADHNAIIGSRLMYYDHRKDVQCWGGGNILFFRGSTMHAFYTDKLDYLTGASMLFDRDAFEKTGGFDEGFFMYWEDADFCRRALKIGKTLRVANNAVVYHKVSRSTDRAKKTGSDFLHVHTVKGVKRYFKRHYTLTWLVPVITRSVQILFDLLRHGRFRSMVLILNVLTGRK